MSPIFLWLWPCLSDMNRKRHLDRHLRLEKKKAGKSSYLFLRVNLSGWRGCWPILSTAQNTLTSWPTGEISNQAGGYLLVIIYSVIMDETVLNNYVCKLNNFLHSSIIAWKLKKTRLRKRNNSLEAGGLFSFFISSFAKDLEKYLKSKKVILHELNTSFMALWDFSRSFIHLLFCKFISSFTICISSFTVYILVWNLSSTLGANFDTRI